MSITTYAFAPPSRPDEMVWGEPHITKEGEKGYWLINGSWFYQPEKEGGELIWKGVVPEKYGWDYKAAIEWIKEQVAS